MFNDVDQHQAGLGPDGTKQRDWRPGHRSLLNQTDDGFKGTAIEEPRGRILNAVPCCKAHQTNFTT